MLNVLHFYVIISHIEKRPFYIEVITERQGITEVVKTYQKKKLNKGDNK